MAHQVNVWDSTRALLGQLTQKLQAMLNRPVKQNEVVDMALAEFAAKHGMTQEDIEKARRAPITRPSKARS